MKKFIVISSLFFACATGEQMTAHQAPPAPASPPIAENEVTPYAQPAAARAPEPSAHAKKAARVEMKPSASARIADNAAERSEALSDKKSGAGTAMAPAPQLDRPGLATSWGETRYSPVNEVSFERDSTRPTCQGSLWYNDRNGAQAAGRNAAWSDARLPIGCGVSLELHGDNGGTLTAVRSGTRLYAIGESNQRYTITVHNDSNARYEMVVSVDGLDVINGRPAGFAQRGYLVPAHGSVDIEGFRRSGAEVAAFRFGSVSDSYAAQSTGSARNVGVIGIAAFAERGAIPAYSYRELEQRRNADPFPSRYAQPVANNIVY